MNSFAKSLLALSLIIIGGTSALGVEPEGIRKAIDAGTAVLLSQITSSPGPVGSLMAVAAFHGGAEPTDPVINLTVRRALAHCQNGHYHPGENHIYMAGIEAVLLSDTGGDKYAPELTLIRDYLLEAQQENGGWNYPERDPRMAGDVSVTHYGTLGLWAIQRAGVKVDPKVWSQIIDWHLRFQNRDGGFAYCPREILGTGRGGSEVNMTVNAMGSLHIALSQLQPGFSPLIPPAGQSSPSKGQTPKPPEKKFGILEPVVDEGREADRVPPVRNTNRNPNISPKIGESIQAAHAFLVPRFREVNLEAPVHRGYYYYSLERMATLANLNMIGEHDWFQECAEYLVKHQNADGTWRLGPEKYETYVQYDTAFAVLFLSRATLQTLGKEDHGDPDDERKYGNGLLVSGRGLPDDLTDVEMKNGDVVSRAETVVDELLPNRPKMSDADKLAKVEDANDLSEKISASKESLVGQTEKLKTLVTADNPRVRQNAVWAIGRTRDLKLARYLIDALSDSDIDVAVEARNALCRLSRKLDGFELQEDPRTLLPEGAAEQYQRAIVATWQKDQILAWGKWYLENQLLEDRDQTFELKLRAQLQKLKAPD